MWSGWFGHLCHGFFSESVQRHHGLPSGYNCLVKKVVFKVEMLPIIKLLSCLMVHALS